MDEGPIREEKTIFEKFKDLYKKVMKPVKEENYFVSPYKAEFECINFENYMDRYTKNISNFGEAIRKAGMSSEQMANGILEFNDALLMPNEMRVIMKNRKM